ncbi:hypothetical protein KEJ39_01060, partial [Candidatus Bathyarchaeota archaeon]|nr:hypothetical protein [Candidatus Bathyarchaeota archaeon]
MDNIKRVRSREELEKLRQRIEAKKHSRSPMIAVSVSTCAIPLGAMSVVEALKAELMKQGLAEKVEIKE